MNLMLVRFGNFDDRTLGQLSVQGRHYKWWTIEKPWEGNLVNESCIPCGHYECHRVDSPKHGPTWEVPVPGRTHILFHVANTAHDILGCIGMGHSLYADLKGVGHSVKAFENFMAVTEGYEHLALTIYQAAIGSGR